MKKGETMPRVEGRLVLKLLPGGGVEVQFTPQTQAGNPTPYFLDSIDAVRADLVKRFGLEPSGAEKRVAELKQSGEIVLEVAAADEALP